MNMASSGYKSLTKKGPKGESALEEKYETNVSSFVEHDKPTVLKKDIKPINRMSVDINKVQPI